MFQRGADMNSFWDYMHRRTRTRLEGPTDPILPTADRRAATAHIEASLVFSDRDLYFFMLHRFHYPHDTQEPTASFRRL